MCCPCCNEANPFDLVKMLPLAWTFDEQGEQIVIAYECPDCGYVYHVPAVTPEKAKVIA